MSIADLLNLPRSSISTIINIFDKEGVVLERKRGGDRRNKLTAEQKIGIREYVDEDPVVTLHNIRQWVYDRYSLTVSISTVDRCLRGFHYTVKNTISVPERRNCERTIELRYVYGQQFHEKFLEFEDKSFVFIDEVGFCVSSRTKRGRSLIGTGVYVSTPSIRSRNISVIAAMTKYGMINHKINFRPVTGEDFKEYLEHLKGRCIEMGIFDPIFILDNARIHHYNGLSELIIASDLKLFYLPPYSPFLNPIENCFSKWKNFVIRGAARNEDELYGLLESGFDNISEVDCNGFFRKMLRYVERSRGREIINE